MAVVALIGLAGPVAISGCATTPTPPRPVSREPLPPVVTNRLARERPRRLLVWPMRNDAAADLLAPADLALLRFHSGDRDRIAMRLGGMRLVALDESLHTPLSAAGVELVTRDREAAADLAASVQAVDAEALLTARIIRWDREPEGKSGVPVRVSLEIALIEPGEPRPLWTWRVDGHPLGATAARRVELDARALLSAAGRRLAAELVPDGATR